MLETFIEYLRGHIYLLYIILFAALLSLLFFMYKKSQKNVSRKYQTRKMTTIAILSALSIVLYFVKFNLGFVFPEFLEIQFSNVPALIGGFLFDPISGITIVIIRTIIKLPFSQTIGIGELADLVIGTFTILISANIYHKTRTKRSAIYSLIAGSITWTVIAILSNWLFLIPFYIALYFHDVPSFVGACSVIPGINESNYMINYLLFAILPFNIILSSSVCFVTFLVYKRTSLFFHKDLEE